MDTDNEAWINLFRSKQLISLLDQEASVTITLGEKVTVRIEESAVHGFLWSPPRIKGDGLSLDGSRSLRINDPQVEYREFVFRAHHSGRNLVSASLRQAGLEEGIKNFSMIVDVLEPAQLNVVLS
ncbi:MAG: putative secreted protein [Candidatus Azotimanducaceae bacterium]